MPDVPPLPEIASQPLSVVLLVPADRPDATAEAAAWIAFLEGREREYELILTAPPTTLLPEPGERIHLVRHDASRGEGAALRSALALARHPLLFYTRCDSRYRPEDLGKMLGLRLLPDAPLEIDRVHLLSGYRAGWRVPWIWRLLGLLERTLGRLLLSYAPPPLPGWLGWRRHAGRLLARILFGVRYHDVACPFRLLRREIFARMPLQAEGAFAHVEILAKANFLGYYFSEQEMPLGDATHPVTPEPERPGDWRRMLAEGRAVFHNPDFGPVETAETTSGSK